MTLISQLLLELRGKSDVTNEATMFLSEKILKLIRIDRKEHSSRIYRSFKQNQNNFELDHETSVILFSRSPFELPCQHFCGQKALTNYIKTKDSFISPTPVSLGSDTLSATSEMQYVSILSTLEMLLNHEDVLCEVINPKKSKLNIYQRFSDIYERFSDGEAFKGSNFWNETESMKLEIILYHYDFNVVNPLGNKSIKCQPFTLCWEIFQQNTDLVLQTFILRA